MAKLYTKLTDTLFNAYGERGKLKKEIIKKDIHFIYDIHQKGFIPVPSDMEHIDLICKIISISLKDLQKFPEMAEHLIPVIIIYETDFTNFENIIDEIVIGVSGTEIKTNVRHFKKDIKATEKAVRVFVKDYKKSQGFKIKTADRYFK